MADTKFNLGDVEKQMEDMSEHIVHTVRLSHSANTKDRAIDLTSYGVNHIVAIWCEKIVEYDSQTESYVTAENKIFNSAEFDEETHILTYHISAYYNGSLVFSSASFYTAFWVAYT